MTEDDARNIVEKLRGFASDSMGMEPGDRQILAEAADEIERINRMLDLIYETANHHSLDCQWCALVADDIKQYSLDRSKEQ